MEFLETVLETLVSAARSVWPGFIGAALLGYFGAHTMVLPGFLVGAALGAVGGTWGAVRLGLVKVRNMTGSVATDQMLYASGAFLLVALGYFLIYIVIVLAVVVALAAAALFWVSA